MSTNLQPRPKVNELRKLLEAGNAERLAVAALFRNLRARRSFYDSVTKQTKCEPDAKTQVQAAELILAYAVGRPLERKEVIETKVDSMQTLENRARNSPETMAGLERMLERIKGQKTVEVTTKQSG